jgi:hypothetical protein
MAMSLLTDQIAALILAGMLGVIALFQLMLALGRPWGQWAYGGFHEGVLPDNLRMTSTVAVAVWSVAALLVLEAGEVIALGISPTVVRPAMWTLAAVLGLGTLMNAISGLMDKREAMNL